MHHWHHPQEHYYSRHTWRHHNGHGHHHHAHALDASPQAHHHGLSPHGRHPHHGAYRHVLAHHHAAEATSAPPHATAEAPNPIGRFIGRLFGQQDAPEATQKPAQASYTDYGSPAPTTASVKPSPGMAIYDISAGKVYMPNRSEPLEAHSGVGAGNYDNVASANRKMQGVTPPGVYNLSLREASFHGVEALRLTPASGTDTHGRNGLLAHTYMLRNAPGDEPGASNGCVSFKNYDQFLQAYKSGDVRQLLVVPHLNAVPQYAHNGKAPAVHAQRQGGYKHHVAGLISPPTPYRMD